MFWAHHHKKVEVSGMGRICPDALKEGKILVVSIEMLDQENTGVYTEMTDEAMSTYYDKCFNDGLKIDEFGCVWLHTHPGDSVIPSGTDWTTFGKTFGRHPWALMLILGKGGDMSAHLKSNFPTIMAEAEVLVGWTNWPSTVSPAQWAKQYDEHVKEKIHKLAKHTSQQQIAFHSRGTRGIEVYQYYPIESVSGNEIGSLDRYRKMYNFCQSQFDRGKFVKTFKSKRKALMRAMMNGITYESEVRMLLWFNYWLNKAGEKVAYPQGWSTLLKQEGLSIEYHKNGPQLKHEPIELVFPDSDFGAGITEGDLFPVGTGDDDMPMWKDTDFDSSECGAKVSMKIMAAAVKDGEPFFVEGRTFYMLGEDVYYPRQMVVLNPHAADLAMTLSLEEEADTNGNQIEEVQDASAIQIVN